MNTELTPNTEAIEPISTPKKINPKKKKAILIFAIVAAALLTLTVILALVLHKDYIEKSKFDHIGTVSYNDVRIVGRDGLLYLSRDGKLISDGYVSLRSVNDGYSTSAPHWQQAEDTVLFDYYIARRAGLSQYLLVTAAGEEYTISGDNYSLAEIRLPYLIFMNNTTGRRAALSLLRIDSDLSRKSGNELTLVPFSEITPVREHEKDALYSHLEVKDETLELPYAVFTADGTQILATKNFEKKIFTDGEKRTALYYVDNDTHTVYSSRGEAIAVGSAPIVAVSDKWGYLPFAPSENEKHAGIAVFSYQKSYRITDESLDPLTVQIFDAALALPVKDSTDIMLYTAADGTQARYASLENPFDGILRTTLIDSADYLYLNEGGRTLLRSAHADMMPDMSLSTEACTVFTSAAYDAEHDGARHLHITREGSSAVTATIEEGVTATPLLTSEGMPVDGVFLLQSEQNGHPVYRLLSPFSPRLFSDTYDRIETYCTADIVWARGTSYERKSYTFLDPIAGQIAGTVNASEEDFAKLLFEFADCQALLGDSYDADSAVPILLLRLSCFEDETVTSSVRYFALYRSLPSSAQSFDQGTLRVLEVGKNLLRDNPVRFFPEENAIVCHNTDFSHVYRLNDANVLSEVAMLPYHVSHLLSDSNDPTIKYFVVTSDDGKCGLYDEAAAPILPPYYDRIQSVDNGHIVVSLRGAMGVLAYDGNKLRQVIDYRYTNITPLPDHGYLAVDGNECVYLFEGKKEISDKPIQSYEYLTSYTMSEDGSLRIGYTLLLSMDGALWVHESDVRYAPRVGTVTQPTVTDQSMENLRAIAVYYYHDGSVIDVDVIYPTDAYRAAFTLASPPIGNGWYAEAEVEAEAAIPLTEADIMGLGEYIVKVYTSK